MENITEQSIIDKANKLYSIECTSISEVIMYLVRYGHKEISSHGVYLLLSAEDRRGMDKYYITLECFKGSVCVFEGRESYFGCFDEQWFYDGEIKYICLKLIDKLAGLCIAKKKEQCRLQKEKNAKRKKCERIIIDDIIDRFRPEKKDKPKLWNFLFNWKKQ